MKENRVFCRKMTVEAYIAYTVFVQARIIAFMGEQKNCKKQKKKCE